MEKREVFKGLAGRNAPDCFASLRTPCYVVDEERLEANGKILAAVAEYTGCRILLAQKAFSNYDFYPLLAPYLAGTEASGLYEARLGAEEMPGKEVHVFCAAYREDEFGELLRYADHIVFNSVSQLRQFGKAAREAGKSVGLRINPECSTQEGRSIYDPCAPGSRLGVTREVWNREMTDDLLDLLDGLHFHTLCEQDADALETTLAAAEIRFGDVLPRMKWLNMGGGHHITREDYDVPRLENLLRSTREKWNLQVYLEPGEAVALNAGYLVTTVLDVTENSGIRTAVLDASAACHMPDVIEMPYIPPLLNGEAEGTETGRFRLTGPTCLAGDVIGDYSMDAEPRPGDRLVFGDMAIYTTCKNNTFNGMPLPDIYSMNRDGEFTKLTGFGYEDFKGRLGSGKRE